MRGLFENCASTPPDIRCLPVHILLENNDFATIPMRVTSPARLLESKAEEEVYTSFEEAIRERAARISHQLSSRPVVARRHPANTAPGRLNRCWRPAITIACLALSLLLAGFDLMGLLIILR